MPKYRDQLLTNATVRTFNQTDQTHEAIFISNQRIRAVGSIDDLQNALPNRSDTEIIDLAGRTLIPGLVDAHVHMASTAWNHWDVDCRDTYDPTLTSNGAIARKLKEESRTIVPGRWIIGMGSPLQESRLKEGRLPDRHQLDRACPDHPAFILFGAYALSANTRALCESGLWREAGKWPHHLLEREPETGYPNGIVRKAAGQALRRLISSPTEAEAEQNLREYMYQAASRGITTVHDFLSEPKELVLYQRLAHKGRLPIRVQLIIKIHDSGFPADLFLRGKGPPDLQHPDLFVAAAKISVDGGFTGGEAAFYENEGEAHLRLCPDELNRLVAAHHQKGVRLALHAFGDRAADLVLAAFDAVESKWRLKTLQHRVEHMGNWCFDADRRRAAKRLHVMPVPNPALMYFLGDYARQSLTPRQNQAAFNLGSMRRDGLSIAGGSDAFSYWPADVLRDLYPVVWRKSEAGTVMGGEEALSIKGALRAQTVGAAALGKRAQRSGQLQTGFDADLTLLSHDPFDNHHLDPRSIEVEGTMVGGKWVTDPPYRLN